MTHELRKLLKTAACSNVAEICKPLFTFAPITLFIHARIYKDGNYWALTNRDDWISYFHQAKYINPEVFDKPIKSGRYLALKDLDIPDVQLKVARESFNADYWFNIIETQDDYYDITGFATHRNNSTIIDTYLNDFDVYQHFLFYFKDKAHALIENAEMNRVLQPSLRYDQSKITMLDENKIRKENFYAQTPIKKYYLNPEDSNKYITQREFDCLNLMAKGKQIKEIARDLMLAPRTIESYLNNIRTRLGCRSRSQLMDIFRSTKREF